MYKLESDKDYCCGSFAVHDNEIFIHTSDKKSGSSNICVFNKGKGKYIRKLWHSNWRGVDPTALCIKNKFLYTIARGSTGAAVVKLSLHGDSVHKFNVNIDNRFPTMLQVSNAYIVLVNLSILSVYTMEGRQIACWNGAHFGLHCMTNLAIYRNSIYLTQLASKSDIHRFWLRNESVGAKVIHRKIVPHPHRLVEPGGLCVTSRFLYVICNRMKLVLLDRDGQHLASYSHSRMSRFRARLQINNLVLNGDVLYMYEFEGNEIHLWKLDKRQKIHL